MSTLSTSGILSPLIIGEVLFDCFEDGRRVLGGAPFNVAWNLTGFGSGPTFVSAVGDDADGRSVCERMSSWGMELRGLQTVTEHRTGTVAVKLAQGQPAYDIVFPCAYDFIAPPAFADSLNQFSMLYHGSLAWRGERTRATLSQLINKHALSRFVDINIREPWFDRDWLPDLLTGAAYVKINDSELGMLTSSSCNTADQVQAAVAKLSGRFGPACYFVTCGSRGAYAVNAGSVAFAAAAQPQRMVDTVGAGDAFAAATIDGLLRQLPEQKILDRAVSFAARICAIRGATATDASVYAPLDEDTT